VKHISTVSSLKISIFLANYFKAKFLIEIAITTGLIIFFKTNFFFKYNVNIKIALQIRHKILMEVALPRLNTSLRLDDCAAMIAKASVHENADPRTSIFPNRGSNGSFARILPSAVNSPLSSKQFKSRRIQ